MGTVLSSACNCFGGASDQKSSKLPSTSIENQSKLTSMTEFQHPDTNNNVKSEQLIFRGEKPQLIGTLTNKKPSLDNFLIEKCLGRGAFGKVVLARHVKTRKLFAMKIIRKADIIQNQLVENIVLEKNILQKCNHPFLIKLKYAFQTNLKFYLVMEYIQGGELYGLIKKHRRFTEQQARFYFTEIILGIEYLHKTLNIIYRDLKPENVLLTKEGHVKLIDFGLAKKSSKKSNTLAGTPEYLAPEILKGTPHGKEVDFWSLGILLYEMLVGLPPFNDEGRNFDKITALIIENKPVYPQFLSPTSVDLIKKLLVNNPSERLGSNDIDELKAHPFFSYVNWKNVIQKSYLPPFQNIVATNVRPFMQTGKINETFEQNVFDNLPGFSYNGETALENDTNLSFTRRSKLNFGMKSNQMFLIKKDQKK